MISRRRALLALASFALGPAGVALLASAGRWPGALTLSILLAGYWLAETVAWEVRMRFARRTLRELQRDRGRVLADVQWSREP